MHKETKIPAHEERTLDLATAEAVDYAELGEVAAGYTCLLEGLERAEEAADEGEVWGPALVQHWRSTLNRYCEKYGLKT